jgi:hypothetical protein
MRKLQWCLMCLWWLLAAGVAAAAPSPWRYDVVVEPAARYLAIDARFGADAPREISVVTGAEPFVRQARVADGNRWVALRQRGTSWFLPGHSAAHIRYHFDLRDAARRSEDATEAGGAIESSPGFFLLHPLGDPSGTLFKVHVRGAPGWCCVSGLHSAGAATWEADDTDMVDGAHVAFGPFEVSRFPCAQSTITLAWVPHGLPLDGAALQKWVRAKADAVAAYYGTFPVPAVTIMVLPGGGRKVQGHTDGGGGASLTLTIGRGVSVDFLRHDWTVTHELVHLALPSLRREHHWLEEGIPTYVEPIVRARLGDLSVAEVWSQLVEGLPQGAPQPGDGGLDATPTWGRTYWGGAMFCLQCDLDIRRRTAGQKTLQDALRGILHAGGNVEQRWPIERVLAAGDRATGTDVLQQTYERFGKKPGWVDLDALWKQLGVIPAGDTVRVDDTAPEAALRRAVTDLR